MTEFHFIRPLWLWMLVPLVVLSWCLLRQTSTMTAWNKVCDAHLLPYLIQTKRYTRRTLSMLLLFVSVVLMIISIAGPTWSRFPVPTYQQVQPRVVLLDMSESMLATDLRPDRLSRAKFKLHDLFQRKNAGQFGLVVYTGEPFVVSPLTDDGQTIDALLSSLTPDIMPVEGQQLSSAIDEAQQLIAQAGFKQGHILVLTGASPSREAIEAANIVSRAGIYVSVMPVVKADTPLSPLFEEFAKAGHGEVIPFSDTSTDLEQWLTATQSNQQYTANLQNDIPVWRDQGRWFLIPALALLLPAFRRGWLS